MGGDRPRDSEQVMEPDLVIDELPVPSREPRARFVLKLGRGRVEGARSLRPPPEAARMAPPHTSVRALPTSAGRVVGTVCSETEQRAVSEEHCLIQSRGRACRLSCNEYNKAAQRCLG
jgi:hypothetical protein